MEQFKFQFKGTESVSTLGHVYNQLDGTFKDHIDNIIDTNGHGSCLLRLLRLPENVDVLTPLLSVLMGYYDRDRHFFDINGNQLNVTLEDVLYVTGLPIKGCAVISVTCRDPEASKRVFGDEFSSITKLKLSVLKDIAKDTTQSNHKRLVALLLITVSSFIIPSADGRYINSCYVQFVEHLERVNDYAWGAALLAFLYCGLDKEKKSRDGNFWVLSCFFCFRIPELSKLVGYDIPSVNLQAPLLMDYMKKLQRVSKNHRTGYQQEIERLLTTLESKEITWHPYVNIILDASMKVELQYVTRLAPVICMNHVAYHRSLDLRKQFKVLAKYADMPSLRWKPKKIRHREFKGSSNQDFISIYNKEYDLWNEAKRAEMYIKTPPKSSNSDAAQSPSIQMEDDNGENSGWSNHYEENAAEEDERVASQTEFTNSDAAQSPPIQMEDDNGENSGRSNRYEENAAEEDERVASQTESTVVSTHAFHEKTPQISNPQGETPRSTSPSTWGLSVPHGSGEERLLDDLICFFKGKKRHPAYVTLRKNRKKRKH